MVTKLISFNVGDTCLHYDVQGEGEPLLLIPGSVCDYRTWTHQTEELGKFFKVITLSRRYQYPSKYVDGGDSSIEVNMKDIIALADYLGLESFHMIGYSYGGCIALNLAHQHPHRVKKMVLVEPIFIPAVKETPKDQEAEASFAKIFITGIASAFSSIAKKDYEIAQMSIVSAITNNKSFLFELSPGIQSQISDNIASLAGEDYFHQPLTYAQTFEIQCPTLLVNGDQSPYLISYISSLLLKSLKDSHLLKISNAPHWVHSDQWGKFNKEVTRFFSKSAI